MAGSEFGRGAVSMHQESISAESFRQASAMTGRMPVNPSRESFSPSNREPNPATIRNASAAGSQRFFSPSRGGSFTGANASFRGGNTAALQSGARGSAAPSQGFSNGRGAQGSQGAQGGWNRFTPSSPAGSQPQSSVRGYSSPNAQRQFDSPNTATRGGYAGSSPSYNRSPLNMRQPIVTPRGGYNESRAYSGNNGSYSAPRGGYSGASNSPRGSYSAPRGYSAPSGNAGAYRGGNSGGYRGGGGGGGSRGGGGGHSGGRR